MNQIYSTLVPHGSAPAKTAISKALEHFGIRVLNFVASRGVTVHPLRKNDLYSDRSPALKRLGIDVDAWPTPPAGLFVVEERAVYLRSTSSMTIAHEFGHALDCALGNGTYFSSTEPTIRTAFFAAKRFVTPYAATSVDEYFAECVRAWVGCNDSSSPWPAATRARLATVDRMMFEYIGGLFSKL